MEGMRRAFNVSDPKRPGGAHYLQFLRKTPQYTGAHVLKAAEQVVIERGGTTLHLQDASFIRCSTDIEMDLGFRELLAHGSTWYERHGYAVVGAAARRMRASVADAIRLYADIVVEDIASAVRKQVLALWRPDATWTPVDGSLYNSMNPGTGTQTRLAVFRARRRLQTMLDKAPKGAKLGAWLLSLSCRDHSFFMEAMYGDRYGRAPRWAIAEVAGVRTPTLALFKRANALKRFTGRIVWSKKLM